MGRGAQRLKGREQGAGSVAAVTSKIVSAARSLDGLVRAASDDGERARRLPDELVTALRDASLLRMCVPAVYGGPEVDPLSLMEAIEAVAQADGAAGWCVMIASTTSSLASYLPREYAAEIYGNPRAITGGAFAPGGRGVAVDGGHRVTGRWGWGSGTAHCDWIVGGTRTDADEFHVMFFPAGDVTIVDTWYATGLRGTGSNDFTVDGVVVPAGRSVELLRATRHEASPLGRFPNFSLLACGVASSLLGIARRAVEEIVLLAGQKTPMFAPKRLSEFAMAQIEIASAEAAIGAARAFLDHEVGVAWDLVQAGDPVPVVQRARIRLACTYAGQEAARAVDRCYHTAGGSAVFDNNPLQRCFRDVHTATQHLRVSPRLLETVGKIRLGIDGESAML